MKKYAIIVAGGSGMRMGSEIPKQFLPINGKPILFYTIGKFLQISDIKIIVVLPEKDIEYFHQIKTNQILEFLSTNQIIIASGGKTRFQSVKNGLKQIKTDGIVAVHDGVRPIINLDIIQKSFLEAEQKGSAVASVLSKDSVRILREDGTNQSIERSKLRLMQTPQTFRLENFRKAFEVDEQPFFTDCASVVEFAGFPINLIEGSYENIKITTPEDLILAESYLKNS